MNIPILPFVSLCSTPPFPGAFPIILGRKSVPAVPTDLPVVRDLLDTLSAHREECVGMAANMMRWDPDLTKYEAVPGIYPETAFFYPVRG